MLLALGALVQGEVAALRGEIAETWVKVELIAAWLGFKPLETALLIGSAASGLALII